MATKPLVGTLVAVILSTGILALVAQQIGNAQNDERSSLLKPAVSSSANSAATLVSSPTTNSSSSQPLRTQATAASAINFGDYTSAPFGPIDVALMTERADLIVVGRIKQQHGPRYLEIAHGMNNPDNAVAKLSLKELQAQMFYVIDIDRVLKGDPTLTGKPLKRADANWVRNISVDTNNGIAYHEKDFSGRGIPQLDYGIIFLTNDKSQMQFVDPDHCILPASPEPLPIKGDTYKAVIDELLHVFTTPVDVLTAKGGAAGGESGSGPDGSFSVSAGELLMRDSMTVITQLPKDVYLSQLKQMTTGDRPTLTRLWAFACLAATSDWSCFSNVQSVLINPPSDLKYAAEFPFVELERVVQTQYGKPFLAALPNLELLSLLKSSDSCIGRTVSHLLEIKQDPRLLEALAQAASVSNDGVIRTTCQAALRRLSNISQDFWDKEPDLALELATGKKSVEPFDSSLCTGAIFDQNKLSEYITGLLKPNSVDRSNYPDWVARAVDSLQQENERNNQSGLFSGVDWLSSGQELGWSMEGRGDLAKTTLAWFTYRTASNPASDSPDKFVIRTTTMCFPIELKNGQFPEMTAVGILPTAKLSGVWRQDDDLILKRQSDSSVRLLKLRSFYAADGKTIKTSPSGLESSAEVSSIGAR